MDISLFGVGAAGASIVEGLIVAEEDATDRIISVTACFDTNETDLEGLDIVPAQYRVLLGEERVKGHGTGASPELGADVFREDSGVVQRTLNGLSVDETDACAIVVGLGGGTGGGGAPVLAERLREVYPSLPVIGVAVLPADDEGGIYHENADKSLSNFVNPVDSAVVLGHDAVGWETQARYPKVGDVRDILTETVAMYT